MRLSFERSLPLADLGNQGRPSTESDTSAHSYTLKDVVITDMPRSEAPEGPQGHGDGFTRASSGGSGVLTSTKNPTTIRGSAQEGSAGRASNRGTRGLRVSMELPADRAIQNLDDALIEGRVVRRRRRLPIGIVVFFGLVSTVALLVALTTLSIGAYNLRKLKASRAAKTVDALSDDISPLIHALYDKYINGTRRTKP